MLTRLHLLLLCSLWLATAVTALTVAMLTVTVACYGRGGVCSLRRCSLRRCSLWRCSLWRCSLWRCSLRQAWALGKPEEYHYLNTSGMVRSVP